MPLADDSDTLLARMKWIVWLNLFSCTAVMFAQSTPERKSEPHFAELSKEDSARLERQRALVAAAIKKKYGIPRLTGTRKDLPILQKLLDDRVFSKSQTYELQSLGVTFGDVLTSEFPLRWVMVTDEYGTDPTLRFRNTAVNINALTMISKRVERDEQVSLSHLVEKTRDAIAEVEKKAQ